MVASALLRDGWCSRGWRCSLVVVVVAAVAAWCWACERVGGCGGQRCLAAGFRDEVVL